MHGWWQYFPIAFMLKTPLPTLLLGVLTLSALLAGRRRSLTEEMALWSFPLVYGLASLTSTLNIGYRHLLPVLPFLFVSSGRLLSISPHDTRAAMEIDIQGSGWWRAAIRYSLLLLLVLWLVIETTCMRPHFLAYFNSLAGQADQGYRYLADSNTDWGQTLKALAAHQRSRNLGAVRLSQFTFLDPATYGVAYEPIAPMVDAPPVLPRRFNPEPGLYAISATTLDGVPLPLPAMYDWFRHREPIDKVGHVMFLYDVADPGDRPRWVAQCASPVVPLTADAAIEGFGVSDLRQIVFDCEQSWVYPEGGTQPGWYVRVVPESIGGLQWPTDDERLELWPEWTTGLSQDALRLSYAQPTPGELPPFAIWQWDGATVAPSESLDNGEVPLDEMVAFMGYEAPREVRPGETVDVLTFWRVRDVPERPLSLMLHLVGAGGVPVAVGDGLGVPIDQWKSGDVIVQRHSLVVPSDAPEGEYGLQTGAYWLDTMERWLVNETSNDTIVLAPIEIKR